VACIFKSPDPFSNIRLYGEPKFSWPIIKLPAALAPAPNLKYLFSAILTSPVITSVPVGASGRNGPPVTAPISAANSAPVLY